MRGMREGRGRKGEEKDGRDKKWQEREEKVGKDKMKENGERATKRREESKEGEGRRREGGGEGQDKLMVHYNKQTNKQMISTFYLLLPSSVFIPPRI